MLETADPSDLTSPLRRSSCSSIRKGVPPCGWKNRAEARRKRLLSKPWPAGFRPRRRAQQAQGKHPHQKPPSRQSSPLWTYQARLTGSLESSPWNCKLSLPPEGPPLFPCTTLPSRSPTPCRGRTQGRTRDLGPGQALATVSSQVNPVKAGRTHVHRRSLPWGVRPVPPLGG